MLAIWTVPVSAQVGNPQPPAIVSKVSTGKLDIPDEMAPAVIPYLYCLNSAVNKRLAKSGGAKAEELGLIESEATAECRPVREKAAVNADKLLKKNDKKIKKPERSAKIETVLVNIEDTAAGFSKRMDQLQADADKQVNSNAPNP
jgi:hypothetical protein